MCDVAAIDVHQSFHEPHTLSSLYAANQRLAKGAHEPGTVDIHQDAPVLFYLTHGKFPPKQQFTLVQIRRITRRAKGYRVKVSEKKEHSVHRVMPNGTLRQVPSPEHRQAIVSAAHETSGHFGVRRTGHLVRMHYWWQGVTKFVQDFVAACTLCDRTRSSFGG